MHELQVKSESCLTSVQHRVDSVAHQLLLNLARASTRTSAGVNKHPTEPALLGNLRSKGKDTTRHRKEFGSLAWLKQKSKAGNDFKESQLLPSSLQADGIRVGLNPHKVEEAPQVLAPVPCKLGCFLIATLNRVLRLAIKLPGWQKIKPTMHCCQGRSVVLKHTEDVNSARLIMLKSTLKRACSFHARWAKASARSAGDSKSLYMTSSWPHRASDMKDLVFGACVAHSASPFSLASFAAHHVGRVH